MALTIQQKWYQLHRTELLKKQREYRIIHKNKYLAYYRAHYHKNKIIKIMKIEVINKSQHQLPVYATDGSAGLDLRASFTQLDSEFKGDNFEVFDDCIILHPGGRILIPTDIYVAIPEGYELQIRPRSGLAIKNGISMVNCVGTIDSDYRGNIGIILINHDLHTPFKIVNGDRIAQAILSKYEKIEWKEVNELTQTKRSEGGFGHTNTK